MGPLFSAKRTYPQFPAPPAFRFGVATADHQCEAYTPEGRDIRDVYEEKRQLQLRGAATDFWNRYGEDAALAAGLGCTAFRLSLSWARLEPQPGVWDDAAFAHYRDVLVKLHENDLEPFVTLHHNTWPVHVENRGGMVHRDFPVWFEAYAREVARRLGDLIAYYVTLNEPNQLVYGFIKPWWSRVYPMPPGLKIGATTGEQIGKVAQLIPNLFRANARAYDAIHAVHRDNAAAVPAWPQPKIGANPLMLGLPPWLQRFVDRNATKVRTADDLAKQARKLTERRLLESGEADVVMAQLTLTLDRTDDIEFSEAYFVAHLALLSRGAPPAAGAFEGWRGHVAAARDTTAVDEARARFPAAAVVVAESTADAVAQLRDGRVELVLDDDVVLRPFVADGLVLTAIANTDAPYAAAVAPGNRDLLNAIDVAIRAYKEKPAGDSTPWKAAVQTHLGAPAAMLATPKTGRRANASGETRNAPPVDTPAAPTYGASALKAVQKRKVLKVAVHPGIVGLCTKTPDGDYTGLEPDLARYVAAQVCGDARAVRFVEVSVGERMSSVRSWRRLLDPILRVVSVFSTIVTTNWWNLGLSGRLAPVLCPPECRGKLDYVGLDYYWGISSLGFNRIRHLFAASEQKYANAPVWPAVLCAMLHEHAKMFPGKPVFVIENGSVDIADSVKRDVYLKRHVSEVQRARAEGVPVGGYLCWAITSNREWGLKFDENSNFGLYYIDLDNDATLKRCETKAALAYRKIVQGRSAN
ncbi:MAG: beta-glucosidase/6-phospho-beta-glucosidase/beta-galactosidase [Candidatus Eremiobacteraeota bacterium]|nr:beta-glucosidase/6-phospho-beta-glucosidase/beta-galactosidase [Candidatus Eremiobacteraeota bacterium]